MNRDSCRIIEELLVDFADDTLSCEEAARVRKHIEQCPQCRAMVEALKQSLGTAQAIWRDNAHEVSRARAFPSHRWRYLAAAAVILLAVGTLAYWPSRRPAPPDAPTLAEIENRMAQSATAARLLAIVDQLESQPSLRDVAESQYRYILAKYPETSAAKVAQLKLESLR
jgi:anti-sigma factor RsiW